MNFRFEIPTSNRLESLDQLRGIAVLCVLLSHFSIAINDQLIDIQNRTINVGTIGVLIFFCVSGYVIPWSMCSKEGVTSVYGFWIRRIFRLYPIYLITAFLGMSVLSDEQLIAMIKQKIIQDPIGYFLAFFSMTSHWAGQETIFQGLEWTLAYEMIFYCACTVFLVFRKWLSNVYALISVVGAVCFAVLWPESLGNTNIIQKTFFFYLFFLVGLLFYLYNTSFVSNRLFKVLSGIMVFTMSARAYIWYFYWGISYLTLAFIPAVYCFYSILFGRIVIKSKSLVLVGVVSYSIYLTHKFIPHNIPLGTLPPLLKFMAWLLISVFSSALTYKLIEYPAIRVSRKLAKSSFPKITLKFSENHKINQDLGLAWMLAKRDLKNRYASSYAGVTWNIGVPLLYAVINVVVFSILMSGRMGARYADVPFALFYFTPLPLWMFFSDVVGRSTGILRDYSYLVNKIAFPFWVLPLVPIASALLGQVILLVLIGALMVYHGISPAGTVSIYILIWIVCVMLTLGVAYAVSAVAVYIPDLAQIIPVVINILFWLTPILYPATLVEDGGTLWVRSLIMEFNPLTSIVEMSRHVVFGSVSVSWNELAIVALVSFVTLIAGLLVFRKLKSGFADVI